jgi:uncharacterized protein YcbK (DUF882 family)
MKKTALFLIFLFSIGSVSAQSALEFPYKINFTASELKLLNSLGADTIKKLIQIAKLAQASSTKATTTVNSSTVAPQQLYSNTYTPTTPYYNPSTGQYQSSPVTQNQQIQNNNYSPAPNSVAQYTPPLDQSQFKNYDKDLDIKDIDPMCTKNYGIDLSSGSCSDFDISQNLKQTAMKACTAVKKRLKAASLHRAPACNTKVRGASVSFHTKGMAIDLAYDNLNSEERVKVFRTFKINGYNSLGCYTKGGPIHLDDRPGVAARWGRDYKSGSFSYANCPDEVRVAGY